MPSVLAQDADSEVVCGARRLALGARCLHLGNSGPAASAPPPSETHRRFACLRAASTGSSGLIGGKNCPAIKSHAGFPHCLASVTTMLKWIGGEVKLRDKSSAINWASKGDL